MSRKINSTFENATAAELLPNEAPTASGEVGELVEPVAWLVRNPDKDDAAFAEGDPHVVYEFAEAGGEITPLVPLSALTAANADRDRLLAEQTAEFSEMAAAIGMAVDPMRFLDPPDGGEVSLAEQVRRMGQALVAAEADRDRLREALIAAGRHAGAGLADTVSTDFLMLVPEEIRLKIEALTADRDRCRREAEAMRDRLARELEEAREALKPFAKGDIDVSGAAVIVGYPDAKKALARARAALASGEAP